MAALDPIIERLTVEVPSNSSATIVIKAPTGKVMCVYWIHAKIDGYGGASQRLELYIMSKDYITNLIRQEISALPEFVLEKKFILGDAYPNLMVLHGVNNAGISVDMAVTYIGYEMK